MEDRGLKLEFRKWIGRAGGRGIGLRYARFFGRSLAYRPGLSRACTRSSILYLLFSILPLTGCSFEKDVPRYRAVLDGPVPATIPTYEADQPLSLVRSLQLADADDEAIGISGENFIQALAGKMKDAGNFLPTLSVLPDYTLSKGGGFNFASLGLGSTSSSSLLLSGSSSNSVSHSFSVPLSTSFTGSLANVSTLQAAGKTADQQRLLLLNEREIVLLEVAQSYYTCLTDERQVAVYESSVKFKSEKVRDQRARLNLGAVKPLDVATSESDLASTRVSLIQSRTDSANARSALARLMGVDQVRGDLVDGFVPPDANATLAGWQAGAFARRQDLLAAGRATEAARLKVDAAIREYFPSVTINFQYFLYNDPTSSSVWTNGISANIPIFSALSIEADVRSAWSVYRQTGLTESQTRRQVMDDVNEGFQNLDNSRAKIQELTVEVSAAQKAADLAERSYQLGSESNLDRLTQQDSLLSAQLALVSEQLNEKSDYLNLLRVSGGLGSVLR